jgi:hypothetical protein
MSRRWQFVISRTEMKKIIFSEIYQNEQKNVFTCLLTFTLIIIIVCSL